MPPKPGLDLDLVCDVWERLLKERNDVSLQDVAEALAEQGILSPRTKRAYTRQQIHLALKKTPRGQAILAMRREMSHSGPH